MSAPRLSWTPLQARLCSSRVHFWSRLEEGSLQINGNGYTSEQLEQRGHSCSALLAEPRRLCRLLQIY
eukprot:3568124-Rhodomonas_salina.3